MRNFLVLCLFLLLSVPASAQLFVDLGNGLEAKETTISYWINYGNGTEDMLIALGAEDWEEAILITPLKGTSARTLNISSFPSLPMVSLDESAHDSMRMQFYYLLASQAYPVPFLMTEEKFTKSEPAEASQYVRGRAAESRIIDSTQLQALPENMSQLYLESRWKQTRRGETLMAGVTAETEELFLPGRGHISLAGMQMNSEGKVPLGARYFSGQALIPQELYSFFRIQGARREAVLELEATELDSDQKVKEGKPARIVVYESMIKNPYVWGALLLITISMLSSMAASLVFIKEKPSFIKFFFFGLWNLMSLPMLWLMAYYKEVDKNFTGRGQDVEQQVELSMLKKASIAVPSIILCVTVLLIPASILLELDSLYLPLFQSIQFLFLLIPFFIFLPLILWGIYRHKKILVYNLAYALCFALLLMVSARILLSL